MKYRALRVLAVVLKVLAWVVLVSGTIVSLTTMFATGLISENLGTPIPFAARFFMFLALLGGTLVQFVLLLGSGELISLLFDIDTNTTPVRKAVRHRDEPMKAA